MPDAGRQRERPDDRSDDARIADHEGISRLTDDLLPALIAKLSTTQLGELEVREGEWHIRLRRPYGVGPGEGRRVSDKSSRAQPGHDGHAHARPSTAAASSNGTGAAASRAAGDGSGSGADRTRTIATSPAVGFFTPGTRATSGTRVRAGDSLGTVDVLGVREEVIAPADGVVGSTLVETGTAVEYGQELIRIELAAPASASTEAR